MGRAGAAAVVLGLLMPVLAALAAAAQPQLTRTYAQPTCGFSLRHPEGWRELPFGYVGSDQKLHNFKYLLEDGANPATFLWVSKVLVVHGGQAYLNALVQSEVGEYCLCRLGDSLVWIDRFSTNTMNVSYTIAKTGLAGRLEELIRRIRDQRGAAEYYEMRFFATVSAAAPQPASKEWIQGRLLFLVPVERFRQMEGVIMEMVRSIRLTPPGTTCWE